MTAPTSRVPYVLDALVALYSATVPAVTIFDGPPLQIEDTAAGLFVGCTDSSEQVDAHQDWAELGHYSRNEVITVPHLLFLRTGDNDLSATRLALYAYMAAIESALVADVTLGLADGVIRARIASGPLTQTRTGDGLVLKVEFVVEVQARLRSN